MTYIGRFAPSPTGPLHLGSLFAAVASYLDAKANNGRWLLRIEDLDPPREQPGSAQSIIESLKAHGLDWDGAIIYQSQREQAYEEAIKQLQSAHLCYLCDCSRQQLRPYGDLYPGYCREKQLTAQHRCAIRLIANPPADSFNDRLQGWQSAPEVENGYFNDFIIKRKDGLYAYQLAVVIDDIHQGITDIVRGSDILDSTFKQIYLYNYMQQPPPGYLHLPVINNRQGQKLSKQNLAQPIKNSSAASNLVQTLKLLNQQLPPEHKQQNSREILQWATNHWDVTRIPRQLTISPSLASDIH